MIAWAARWLALVATWVEDNATCSGDHGAVRGRCSSGSGCWWFMFMPWDVSGRSVTRAPLACCVVFSLVTRKVCYGGDNMVCCG
ncbi:hypothetical protein CKAH01_13559 [Colletotrichum kahawae]|uniref:Secreted protein n=1 Tax=Colletotrichum kahawae TaxID=34407 RepID=A0AAE0DBD9_COLKA|nr:hypothetical protein CKAH01_13559 [Colletotrichum kahawae]